MWSFYLLAVLVLWQGIISLYGGLRYLAYIRREMSKKRPDFAPFASVIAPCRGVDHGLRANIAALFNQHYPAYEIIFVTDSPDDPSLVIVEEVRQSLEGNSTAAARVLIAGRASDCGQKVHNLRTAVCKVHPASEVLVFVDTDARPRPDWLRSLIAPLADEQIGATTGYRWFIPVAGGMASHLRAVWNASIASALGARDDRNFCWGGSTAIRRATFEKINMVEQWRGTLSDDFALTRALHRARLPIYFVPNCLTASLEDCTFKELVEFTTRQLKITRVYAPHLWKIVLWTNLFFVTVFFGGTVLVIARAALGLPYLAPLALIVAIYTLGACRAYLRLRAVSLPLASYLPNLRAGAPAHLFLWPIASVLYLYNALAAAFSRRITWRGIGYELKSPTETVIISNALSEEIVETKPAHHAS